MKKIELSQTGKEGLKKGVKSDGTKYSVRDNRDRFLYPNEYNLFFAALKNDRQRITFDILMGTGARINEVTHIKVQDIDLERCNIMLRVTKVKAKKQEKNPRPRTVSISTTLSRRIRKWIKKNNLMNDDYLELSTASSAHLTLKRTLERIGVRDWWMVSLHNIRKTHGNYLKAIGVDGAEICLRLGHDYNTFLTSYGSPNIFSQQDIREIRRILGDIYDR